VVGGENIFLSLNVITVPAGISLLTMLAKATTLVDLWPRQVITLLTFDDTPSHVRMPSMGNKWLDEMSLDHTRVGGNISSMWPPAGK
jgi:hypothetical protein